MHKTKPQGTGIVKVFRQSGTTGNYKKIESSKGKGAAISALKDKSAKRSEMASYSSKRRTR